ncbi:MAG: ABC transporter substrate-binding protein, partial [Terriglobia bacterium]
PESGSPVLNALHKGLGDQGFVEGRNFRLDYRLSEDPGRLPVIAAEFVAARVAVILATGGVATAIAAKHATSTIPIVFVNGTDPVKIGLVRSLARPGENITGVNMLLHAAAAKQLQLLRELVPGMKRVVFLFDSKFPGADTDTKEMSAAAHKLGLELHLATARTEPELDDAFAAFAEQHVDSLVIGVNPFISARAHKIVAHAAQRGLPAISSYRHFVEKGGLISYGTDISAGVRQGGVYAGRILKGAKPAELPVVQLDKIALAINLTTTKVLGLTIPPTLFARADEVIE